MKKLIKQIDNFIFLLTEILFSLIPMILIIGGGLAPVVIILIWYFERSINLNDLWYIFGGLLITWMGFKWDDAVISHYNTAIERKNSEKNKAKN